MRNWRSGCVRLARRLAAHGIRGMEEMGGAGDMGSLGGPAISVIMSIYNQKNRKRLEEAVYSILGQSFTDFEFIIYDDGSDRELAGYLHRFGEMDDRVVLISNPENHGLAYSLNTCIHVARGKYLARMDDDDVSAADRLKVQYEFMESHPEVAYAGCNAKLLDDNGVWGMRRMPERPGRDAFLKCSPFIHPTVMIRRSVFVQGNRYSDARENWRCEDYELFMRLEKLGYRGWNIQRDLFFYREDRNSYAKRKFCYRMDEMRIRYRNFKELGILYPLGWLYVVRPLLAAAVPAGLIWKAKRLYHRQDVNYEEWNREKEKALSEDFEKTPTIV